MTWQLLTAKTSRLPTAEARLFHSKSLGQFSEYGMQYDYGNGNFNFGIGLLNIFRKHTVEKITEINGPYKMQSRKRFRGRSVMLNVTYTFDYGKKVSPNI